MRRVPAIAFLLTLSLLSAAPLLADAGAPSDVVVHLVVSDSVRAHENDGDVKVRVSATNNNTHGVIADVENDTATLHLTPGEWKLRTMIVAGGEMFVADPAGSVIEVPSGARTETTLTVSGGIATTPADGEH